MRKLALFVLGFSAAIFLSQYFLGRTAGLVLAGAAALVALALLIVKKKPAAMLRIAAFGLAVGALWNFAYHLLFFDHAVALNGYKGGVTAVVADYPQKTDYGVKTEIKIQFKTRPWVNATLYLFGSSPELSPGNIIHFEGELVLASEKVKNDYFASRGVPLFAYADSEIELGGEAEHSGLRFFHKRAAKAVKDKIAEIFPDFSRPFMTAILTGDRALLNRETYLFSVLATTGAAHVVAVSGMHVAFLVNLLRMLFGKNRAANLLCIPVILLFMAMTGFAASVVRAGIMQITMLLGAVLRRDYDDITSLSLALLILLMLNPVSIKNGGLQLSFAATLGIILFGNKIYSRVSAPFEKGRRLHRLYRNPISRKAVSFVCAVIASSFGALALTIPFSAVMFGYVSVVAPIVNILILWAVTLAFSVGLICVLVGFIFAPAGAILAWVPSALTLYISGVTTLIAKLPFASVYTDSIYIRAWLVFMYAELAFLSAVKVRGKFTAFLVSNLAVLACSICFAYVEAGSGSLTASVLDVGQGQSVVLSSEGKTAIVDCGGSLNANAGDIAAEQLASMGETQLDALILTHFHSDHANGALELMRRVKIDKLIVPQPEGDDEYGQYVLEYAASKGTEIITVTYTDYIMDLGLAELTVIPPLGAANDNERGLSVICTSGRFDILITGDMSSDTEYRFIEYADIPKIELLVAGHHGSRYSTSEALLEIAEPDIVAISVGTNPYGHPADELLSRVQESGAEVYRTDKNGMITVKLGKQ
ncbi:MAG: DNA internalization-related competence protein ComEC/Rec2 [Clostridiales bacterium]|nr:DNA internalization-related competence protein ComEC/Rec2 [Clostridiales bacterium]